MRLKGSFIASRRRWKERWASSPSRTMSVSIQLGWIVATSTPRWATSLRSELHIASTPAFEAAYADSPGACAKEASEAVTARYPRCSQTAGSAARSVL